MILRSLAVRFSIAPFAARCALAACAALAGLTAPAAAQEASDQTVVIISSTADAYPSLTLVPLNAQIALEGSEQLNILSPSVTLFRLSGPDSGVLADLIGVGRGRVAFSELYAEIAEQLVGARAVATSAARGLGDPQIDGWTLWYLGSSLSPTVFCTTGAPLDVSVPEAATGGVEVRVDAGGGVHAPFDGGMALLQPGDAMSFPTRPIDGARYHVVIAPSQGHGGRTGSVYLDMEIVPASVLAPGPDRFDRLIARGCVMQALADRAL